MPVPLKYDPTLIPSVLSLKAAICSWSQLQRIGARSTSTPIEVRPTYIYMYIIHTAIIAVASRVSDAHLLIVSTNISTIADTFRLTYFGNCERTYAAVQQAHVQVSSNQGRPHSHLGAARENETNKTRTLCLNCWAKHLRVSTASIEEYHALRSFVLPPSTLQSLVACVCTWNASCICISYQPSRKCKDCRGILRIQN